MIADTHGCYEYPDEKLLELWKMSPSYDGMFLLGDISIRELQTIRKYFKCPLYGLDFVGWSGSIKYKNSDRSMMTDEESIDFAKTLPHADILISHDIPKRDTKDFSHSGLKGISMYLEEHKIALHIHGHIHVQEDVMRENGTRSIGVFPFAEMVIHKNAVVTINNL